MKKLNSFRDKVAYEFHRLSAEMQLFIKCFAASIVIAATGRAGYVGYQSYGIWLACELPFLMWMFSDSKLASDHLNTFKWAVGVYMIYHASHDLGAPGIMTTGIAIAAAFASISLTFVHSKYI